MTRISLALAKEDWARELRSRNWQAAKISVAMFDYEPSRHGKISYFPSPGWPTIAGQDGCADLEEWNQLKAKILRQGNRYSSLGRGRGGSAKAPPPLVCAPMTVTRETIVQTIQSVMRSVHPQVVTQEQILRSAFISHLPYDLARGIGTPYSAIHLERPTPSLYQHTGEKPSRARFDVGIGGLHSNAEIRGAIELKAGLASFDNLQRKGELTTMEPDEIGTKRKRKEPISIDLLKLLDPGIPNAAFRISWIALGKLGRAESADVQKSAGKIVEYSSGSRGMDKPSMHLDSATGWLVFGWAASKIELHLAWYRPSSGDATRYAPVWS